MLDSSGSRNDRDNNNDDYDEMKNYTRKDEDEIIYYYDYFDLDMRLHDDFSLYDVQNRHEETATAFPCQFFPIIACCLHLRCLRAG